MSLFLIISLIALAFCIYYSLHGASKTTGGLMGKLACLSMPVWLITIMVALSLPQEEGFSTHEKLAVGAVVIMTLITMYTNAKDNKRIYKEIKGVQTQAKKRHS